MYSEAKELHERHRKNADDMRKVAISIWETENFVARFLYNAATEEDKKAEKYAKKEQGLVKDIERIKEDNPDIESDLLANSK